MFTLLSTVSELYCAYCASVYFISFSHGYSAILAAKLMIKLDLTDGMTHAPEYCVEFMAPIYGDWRRFLERVLLA